MFNITLDVSLINTINLIATILAPLIIIGLWGFGLGCLTKALLVVGLRLVTACSAEESEVMSLDMALWHAEMAELPDFDPSEFEPAKQAKFSTIAIVEEEEDDIILATFGVGDLTKWEPASFNGAAIKNWYAQVALEDLRLNNARVSDHMFYSM